MCPPSAAEPDDPEPKTRTIILGCSNNTILGGLSLIPWELTVNPTAIRSGGEFAAKFEAIAIFPEYFLNVAQSDVGGGLSRVNIVEHQATDHVRRGATDQEGGDLEDVPLAFELDSIPWTCRYDGNGDAEFGAGPFPSCSEDNDNLDDSNEDCTGLGGVPHPENQCGKFKPIPISNDCTPGGVCDSLGDPFPHLNLSPLELCDKNGFCVRGPVEVTLRGGVPDDYYYAAASGHVLFGWDDASTGAEIDQTSGPNDGVWILPDAVFEEPAGPNAMRFIAGDTKVALECTMAVGGWGPFGVASQEDLASPAPDHALISFPIQQP
jgi:hypothetical protein